MLYSELNSIIFSVKQFLTYALDIIINKCVLDEFYANKIIRKILRKKIDIKKFLTKFCNTEH